MGLRLVFIWVGAKNFYAQDARNLHSVR
jgi:hypothetical protein